MIHTSYYDDPYEPYLEACSKTLYYHNKLKGEGEDVASNIKLTVKRANDMSFIKEFHYKFIQAWTIILLGLTVN